MASIQSNYEVTPFLQEGELKWMLKDKDQRQDPAWAQARFGFCSLQGVIEKRPCNRSANNVNAPALPIPCSRAGKCCFGVDGSLSISQGCLGTRSHFLHRVSLVCPSWPTGECHHLCVHLALRVALLIKGVSLLRLHVSSRRWLRVVQPRGCNLQPARASLQLGESCWSRRALGDTPAQLKPSWHICSTLLGWGMVSVAREIIFFYLLSKQVSVIAILTWQQLFWLAVTSQVCKCILRFLVEVSDFVVRAFPCISLTWPYADIRVKPVLPSLGQNQSPSFKSFRRNLCCSCFAFLHDSVLTSQGLYLILQSQALVGLEEDEDEPPFRSPPNSASSNRGLYGTCLFTNIQ